MGLNRFWAHIRHMPILEQLLWVMIIGVLIATCACRGPETDVYVGIPGGTPTNVQCGSMQANTYLCVRRDQPDHAYQCAMSTTGNYTDGKTNTYICAAYGTPSKSVTPERAP